MINFSNARPDPTATKRDTPSQIAANADCDSFDVLIPTLEQCVDSWQNETRFDTVVLPGQPKTVLSEPFTGITMYIFRAPRGTTQRCTPLLAAEGRPTVARQGGARERRPRVPPDRVSLSRATPSDLLRLPSSTRVPAPTSADRGRARTPPSAPWPTP